MMLPTHALAGMVLAVPLVVMAPEHAEVALVAGLLGGVWPDLDLYAGHRKTLHYPTYYLVLAVAALPVVLFVGTSLAVGIEVFFLAAAAHSRSDVLGGGLELRPWEGTSNRAVYSHYHRRWLPPARWIRYDGAPEDLLLAVVLGVPLLVAVDTPHRTLVLAALGVAVAYSLVRRHLPALAETLVAFAPTPAKQYLPARYRASEREPGTVGTDAQ
ncbi:metal-dependent hydrolase [Haloarculaceae archaeon H-GB2-1]|nr:metal-dependent hydrolase [Haloarculaceae archaeon H-GB1-1]MEA5389335.1 metal-dependent hydrolase [Haloarculaceae archaeon H-GB11]MEA5409866.1 metal-dependent hydrolase [Haloarculaceae archaeon H-GB2-1]